MRRPRSDRSGRATLEAFCAAFFAGDEAAVPPAETAEAVLRYQSRLDPVLRRRLRLGLALLEHLPPGRRFSRLGPSAAADRLNRMLANRLLRRPLAALRALVVAAHYADDRTRLAMGIRSAGSPGVRPHRSPGPALAVTAARRRMAADLLVIGSGAAGCVVAEHFATRGRDTMVIEAGEPIPAETMSSDALEMFGRAYQGAGAVISTDGRLTVGQGRAVGGSTVVNNGICFRLDDPLLAPGRGDRILDRWTRFGAGLDRAELRASYDRVAARLGVHRLEPHLLGRNAHLLLAGAAQLAHRPVAAGAFPVNLAGCVACGRCNLGCPHGRRRSVVETYLPDAVAAGARLVAGCTALSLAPDRDGRIRTRCAGPEPVEIVARTVVLAGGALQSSLLLQASGIRRNVGRRLSFNLATLVFGEFAEPVNGGSEVPMGSYADFGDVMLESIFQPPSAFAASLPGWFTGHTARMRRYDHYAVIGVLAPATAAGTVTRRRASTPPRPVLRFAPAAADLATVTTGVHRAAETLMLAGADRVFTATVADPAPEWTGPGDGFFRMADAVLISSHPQGGNAMSDAPARGVVDSHFQVHGVPNVFVCDASVFPTALGINPQLTVMALADYFGHQQTG